MPLQDQEREFDADQILSGKRSALASQPAPPSAPSAPPIIRPPIPSNPFGAQQPLALQQHQENLAEGYKQRPTLMRWIGENLLPAAPGQNPQQVISPDLRPDNTASLPIMKNYPLPGSMEEAYTGLISAAKGAYKSGFEPLPEVGRALWHDITRPAQGSELLKKFIYEPAKQQFEKAATDPNLSPLEIAGHGAASVVPVVGPWLADVASRSVPQVFFGPTVEHRTKAIGDIAGPFLAAKAGAVVASGLGTGLRKGGMVYDATGMRRLRKAEARLAVAMDMPEKTVHEALPFIDQFQKSTTSVDVQGRPLATNLKKTKYRGIEDMDAQGVANLARSATDDFYTKNVAPIQDALSTITADSRPILQRAAAELGPIFQEQLRTTRAPVEMRAVARLLNRDNSLKQLLDIRADLNGRLRTLQAKSMLPKEQFLREHPQARFLNSALNGVRDLIDSTIDVNAGRIGQTGGVLKTYANMKEFQDAAQLGAERSAGMETQRLGKRFGRTSTEAQAVGAAAGTWGSKARVVGETARALSSKANMPNALIPSAGKLIERRGAFGLLPRGRSAMAQPLPINWGGEFPGGVPPTLSGTVFTPPQYPPIPPAGELEGAIVGDYPGGAATGRGPFQQGPSSVQQPLGLPSPPFQPPTESPLGLPESRQRALPSGQYDLPEGELYNEIAKKAIRPVEGKTRPKRATTEKLKIYEQRSVRPKEGELDVAPKKGLNIEDFGPIKIVDKRAEFEQGQSFPTAPERMQGQPNRAEVLERLQNRIRSTPEQLRQASETQLERVTERLKSGKPIKKLPKRVNEPPASPSEPVQRPRSPRQPQEDVWRTEPAAGGKVDVYKNDVKVFDEPLSPDEARRWIQKRKGEASELKRSFWSDDEGAIKFTIDNEGFQNRLRGALEALPDRLLRKDDIIKYLRKHVDEQELRMSGIHEVEAGGYNKRDEPMWNKQDLLKEFDERLNHPWSVKRLKSDPREATARQALDEAQNRLNEHEQQNPGLQNQHSEVRRKINLKSKDRQAELERQQADLSDQIDKLSEAYPYEDRYVDHLAPKDLQDKADKLNKEYNQKRQELLKQSLDIDAKIWQLRDEADKAVDSYRDVISALNSRIRHGWTPDEVMRSTSSELTEIRQFLKDNLDVSDEDIKKHLDWFAERRKLSAAHDEATKEYYDLLQYSGDKPQYENYDPNLKMGGEEPGSYEEKLLSMPSHPTDYHEGHWDTFGNRVAGHERGSKVISHEGLKYKRMDEVQPQWAQSRRYWEQYAKAKGLDPNESHYMFSPKSPFKDVPSAVRTLVQKAIYDAVKEGYDGISWTTAAEQSKRSGEVVNKIKVTRSPIDVGGHAIDYYGDIVPGPNEKIELDIGGTHPRRGAFTKANLQRIMSNDLVDIIWNTPEGQNVQIPKDRPIFKKGMEATYGQYPGEPSMIPDMIRSIFGEEPKQGQLNERTGQIEWYAKIPEHVKKQFSEEGIPRFGAIQMKTPKGTPSRPKKIPVVSLEPKKPTRINIRKEVE